MSENFDGGFSLPAFVINLSSFALQYDQHGCETIIQNCPKIANDFVIRTRKVHHEKGCLSKKKLHHGITNLDFTCVIDQII